MDSHELLGLGLNARRAPLDVRERYALASEELPSLAAFFGERVAELLVVSTCERVEVYAVPGAEIDAHTLAALLATYRGLPAGDILRFADLYAGAAAAKHLFRVAGGLDSRVLGETQILGQVRRSLDAARQAGALGRRLGPLVQAAISAGKRVREETILGRGGRSVSRIAVDHVRGQLGDLAHRSVVIVGAGETAQLALKALGTAGRLVVVNRTVEHARALAARAEGPAQARPLEGLAEALRWADVVFACVGTQQPLVSETLVRQALVERPSGSPLLLVDLAVPRGVDPAIAGLDGVHLVALDDLRERASQHASQCQTELPRAEAIVESELERAWEAWREARAHDAVADLRRRAEQIRQDEIARARRHLPNLTEEDSETIELLTRAIVSKLLHQPTTWLKKNPHLAGATLHDLFGVTA